MKQQIIYIPGLSDRYDILRRLALLLWRRPEVRATLVPMRWLNKHESFEEKLARLGTEIEKHSDRQIVLVGESAGGAVAIAALKKYRDRVSRIVTVCGMNQGADVVNPVLYEKNRAFRGAMLTADKAFESLSVKDRADMFTIYSSRDGVIGEKDTLLDGVRSFDIGVPIHIVAIGYVLLLRPSLVIKS